MDAIAAIGKTGSRTKLSPDELAEIAQLAARDREVRAQEMARLAAAGMLANGVDYDYTKGPDGKLYAVAGKIRVSAVAGQTPEATLANAKQIQEAVTGANIDSLDDDGSLAMRAGELETEALRQIASERTSAKHTSPTEPATPHTNKLNDTA